MTIPVDLLVWMEDFYKVPRLDEELEVMFSLWPTGLGLKKHGIKPDSLNMVDNEGC